MRKISPSRASEMLGLSVDSVWRAIRAAELVTVMKGKRTLLDAESVSAYRGGRDHAWRQAEDARLRA